MRATRPLKLIEIPSSQGSTHKFFAKVPDGMKSDHALVLVNAIIKRANQIYSSADGDPDTGAVYDTIVRDLASVGFVVESRLQVLASVAWDQQSDLTVEEQKLIDELDARHVEETVEAA